MVFYKDHLLLGAYPQQSKTQAVQAEGIIHRESVRNSRKIAIKIPTSSS